MKRQLLKLLLFLFFCMSHIWGIEEDNKKPPYYFLKVNLGYRKKHLFFEHPHMLSSLATKKDLPKTYSDFDSNPNPEELFLDLETIDIKIKKGSAKTHNTHNDLFVKSTDSRYDFICIDVDSLDEKKTIGEIVQAFAIPKSEIIVNRITKKLINVEQNFNTLKKNQQSLFWPVLGAIAITVLFMIVLIRKTDVLDDLLKKYSVISDSYEEENIWVEDVWA